MEAENGGQQQIQAPFDLEAYLSDLEQMYTQQCTGNNIIIS
jgi:hypothetical protein